MFSKRKIITDPTHFRERFRLTRRLFEILLQRIGADLTPETSRSHALTASEKLLITLRFFATNQEYYNSGDTQGIILLKI